MKKPKVRPTVKLIGEDGNAFAILGNVTKALRKAGAEKAYCDQYLKDATAGDYNNLLNVSMQYVDVE